MAGKQLLISKLSINPFGTLVIDQHVLLSSSGVTVFRLCSFQIDFKGHAAVIREFPD